MIWWMKRLDRCETMAEYECVSAWWEATTTFYLLQFGRALSA